MCKEYEVARKTVYEFIGKGKPFKMRTLTAEIQRRGGICRVEPGSTVSDFVGVLSEYGLFKIDGDDFVPQLQTA